METKKPVDSTAVLTELKRVRKVFSPLFLRACPAMKRDGSIEHRRLRDGIVDDVKLKRLFLNRHNLRAEGKRVGRRAANIYVRKRIVDMLRESAFAYGK